MALDTASRRKACDRSIPAEHISKSSLFLNLTWTGPKRIYSETNVRKGNNNNKSTNRWKKAWSWGTRVKCAGILLHHHYHHHHHQHQFCISTADWNNKEMKYNCPTLCQLPETVQINCILLIDAHFVYKPQHWYNGFQSHQHLGQSRSRQFGGPKSTQIKTTLKDTRF